VAVNRRTVTKIEEQQYPGMGPCWFVTMTDDDTGVLYGHVFPQYTLAARIAEYDLDPDDLDAVLDIVLHEPHMPNVMDEDPAVLALAAEANVTCVAADVARDAHQRRVAWAKQHRMRVAIPPGVVAPILAKTRATLDEDVRKHRDRVAHERNLGESGRQR
jgi:hypothetical protein